MKVLHFFKTYYPDSFGGVEQVIFQLAEGVREYGYEAEVLALSPRGSIRNECVGGHRVHRSRQDLYLASTGFSLSAFKDLSELAAEADIIHYHFPWPFMDLVHLIAQHGKPTLLTYHSDIVKQKNLLKIYRPLMNYFLKSVDHIVATSPNYLASSPFLPEYQEKISIIPIGIDPLSYPVVDKDRLLKWKRTFGERFFLFVGALRYYKGLHFLLDALIGVDYPLVIVGAGPMELDLKKQAQANGLNNIYFLGALDDIDKCALLELSYGMVFPSHLRSEAFGISLIEGAMFGKPLISCEIGSGTTYINQHEITGIVAAPENSDQLREAMRRLWDDPLLAARYGANARTRFEEFFTAEKMVSSYIGVYNQLLSARA